MRKLRNPIHSFFERWDSTASLHDRMHPPSGNLSKPECSLWCQRKARTTKPGLPRTARILPVDWLLRLRVLRLGFLQDGNIGVGVFPEGKVSPPDNYVNRIEEWAVGELVSPLSANQ